MDASATISRILQQLQVIDGKVSEIEDETARIPQTIQQMCRVATMLHE